VGVRTGNQVGERYEEKLDARIAFTIESDDNALDSFAEVTALQAAKSTRTKRRGLEENIMAYLENLRRYARSTTGGRSRVRLLELAVTMDLKASDGVMKELGRLHLAKPNKAFTAVRFFDNVAYSTQWI